MIDLGTRPGLLHFLFYAAFDSLAFRAFSITEPSTSMCTALMSAACEHRSSLRHLAKDWTAGGVAGRAELHSRIVQAVRSHLDSLGPHSMRARIVVPGCGQARLSWTLACALPHAAVLGIDESAVLATAPARMPRPPYKAAPKPPFLVALPQLVEVRVP